MIAEESEGGEVSEKWEGDKEGEVEGCVEFEREGG